MVMASAVGGCKVFKFMLRHNMMKEYRMWPVITFVVKLSEEEKIAEYGRWALYLFNIIEGICNLLMSIVRFPEGDPATL